MRTWAAARKVAAGLIEGYGVERGDRVAIAMRNANAWCVTYLGVLMAGGCATLLNGWWQGAEHAAGIAASAANLALPHTPRAGRHAFTETGHTARNTHHPRPDQERSGPTTAT